MQLEQTVIISIDESNFRSRVGQSYKWMFDESKVLRKMRAKYKQETLDGNRRQESGNL